MSTVCGEHSMGDPGAHGWYCTACEHPMVVDGHETHAGGFCRACRSNITVRAGDPQPQNEPESETQSYPQPLVARWVSRDGGNGSWEDRIDRHVRARAEAARWAGDGPSHFTGILHATGIAPS